MVHVNKGNSNFENRIDDIYIVLDKLQPHILSIQEANYDPNCNINISGYDIEYKLLSPKTSRARTMVLIKKGINYKRCKQYENDHISSVWLEILLSKNKSFFIMSAYRQWRLPSEIGILNSGSLQAQINKY